MSVVKYRSDRVGAMYLGHLMEEVPAEELLSNTLHPYAAEECRIRAPEVQEVRPGHRVACLRVHKLEKEIDK